MDTCIWVIGIGILKLNRNSAGPSSSQLEKGELNSLGATFDGTTVLSTRSVIF